MEPVQILCGIAVVILALYYYVTMHFDVWKTRNVPGPQPIPLFGNVKDALLAKRNINEIIVDLYKEYKEEPMFGIFHGRTPLLIVKDPDLIKDILIKDFSKFSDRGVPASEKAEPLSQHLFHLEPKLWRPLRTKLSPTFTSGKIKEMFHLIWECSGHMEQYLEKLTSKNEPIECREFTAKYTTDVIGTCAFGIDTQALADEDSEFRRMGKKIFAPTWGNLLRVRIRSSAPRLFNLLGYILPHSEITKFFTRTIMENIEYREKHNVIRHDFVDMLCELKRNPDKISINFTDTLLAAQAFVFFIAGFETSSTTMSHALYELALNQEVQDKLREEIDEVYTRTNGNITYDDIKQMNYLDKVFKETLRMYPPGTFLLRQLISSSYTFNNTKVTIPEKQKVWIPVYAIQHDSDIFPEPDVFNPERFNEKAIQTRHPMFYLPFGDGPRNCIGARFAIYQTKVGLIKILRNYRVETCEKTQIPYKINPKAFILSPLGGIHVKLTKIERS